MKIELADLTFDIDMVSDDMWEDVYNWVLALFKLNIDEFFTIEVIYTQLTNEILDRGLIPPVYADFEGKLKDWIKRWREVDFYDMYFVESDEGWVLTNSHDIVVESITYLENKGIETCEMTSIDEDMEIWQCSECDSLWTLNDGTPKENGMEYCPKCGRKIIYKEEK